MLYSAYKRMRRPGALRSQVDWKQVYMGRRRKRREELKAACDTEHTTASLSLKVRAIEVKRPPVGRAHLLEQI